MKKFRLAALLLILCLLAASCAYAVDASSAVSAYFLNVGKADAALYRLDGHDYLVDTGTSDSAEAMLATLDALGVTRLEGVVITHTDKDHVGGLKKLLKSGVTVERLYASPFSTDDETDNPVVKRSEKYDVPVIWLNAGDVIEIDAQTRFVTLGPLTLDTENNNNNSLVLRLETTQGNLLLTGDMELEEEAALLDAQSFGQIDVLKVAHHGEDDATSERFVNLVRPKLAVISTNTNEEPDTPDPKVMRRLWNVHTEVLVTQKTVYGYCVTLESGTPRAQEIGR